MKPFSAGPKIRLAALGGGDGWRAALGASQPLIAGLLGSSDADHSDISGNSVNELEKALAARRQERRIVANEANPKAIVPEGRSVKPANSWPWLSTEAKRLQSQFLEGGLEKHVSQEGRRAFWA